MKNCPKCGKQIADEALFCAYCGCNIEHTAPYIALKSACNNFQNLVDAI